MLSNFVFLSKINNNNNFLRKEWYFRVCTITSPKSTRYVSSYQDCFGLCNINSTCQSAIYVESNNECFTSTDTTEVNSLIRKYHIKEIAEAIYFTAISFI